MTIETLIKVIPPPATPTDSYTGPWPPIERQLRVVLPPDYKDFVRLYGSGYFMEFLGIKVPRSRNPNIRLISHAKAYPAESFESDEVPYRLWPQPGGLLPFGTTDNGDELFWLPHGPPADWSIIVWDRGFGTFEAFDCDLTDFLAGLATGEILPTAFPEDLSTCGCLFKPRPPPTARRRPRLGALGAEDSVRLTWRFGGFGVGASGASKLRLRGED